MRMIQSDYGALTIIRPVENRFAQRVREPGINGTNRTGVYELARSPMPVSEPGAVAAPSDFI